MKLYVHPDNRDREIIDSIVNRLKAKQDPTIHMVRSLDTLRVVYDDELPIDEHDGWERTNVLNDDKFTIWVDDLAKPDWWEIALGLVKEKRRPVGFLFNNKQATYSMNGILFSGDKITPLGKTYHAFIAENKP